MNFDVGHFSCGCNGNLKEKKLSTISAISKSQDFILLLFSLAVSQLAGCVSDKVEGNYAYPDKGTYLTRTTIIDEQKGTSKSETSTVTVKGKDEPSNLASYRQTLIDQGPQERVDTEGQNTLRPLGILKPTSSQVGVMPDIKVVTDPNNDKKIINLTIEQAIARTLGNSTEIRVVSFDPSIAKQEITKAAAEFDITAFGRLNYEEEDNPLNSIFQPGQSDVRTLESGIKQKSIFGSEWSLSYILTRSWDDLIGRTFPTRYEPILGFQIKQPLLRDAWEDVTLAGVDIARLNYRTALFGFREKAEETAAQVITAYWRLLQARRDFDIQQELLNRTFGTLKKVESRREIDATDVQIKQTEAFEKAREAILLQARKDIIDAQNNLVRLIADPQLNILSDFEIIPVSKAALGTEKLDSTKILETAMNKNPAIQRARIETEIADINIRVAENQKMPRLDLVASARTQALGEDVDIAHDRFEIVEYNSYAIGLSLEYPFGNRQRHAELLKRRLERRKAISALQNVADQVAILAKEGITKIETNYSEIQVQKEAAEAARIQLQALEDSEPIRERLTPEFLLVKLQAQEALASAQRSEIRAVVDFNIALVQLAQISGTVLELHQVSSSMPGTDDNKKTE